MTAREEIFTVVREALVETFGLQVPIAPSSLLVDDLDMDSIDAATLAARLQEIYGKRLAREEFKELRRVEDVVAAVERILLEPA